VLLILNIAVLIGIALLLRKVRNMPTTKEFHDTILSAVGDLKTHVDTAAARVTTALDALKAKIDALSTANPAVDFTDVQTAVAAVSTEVDTIAPTT
jgi:uncharacterized protein YoxC